QVGKILEHKSDDPRWPLAGYHVYPDPRARFGDITNPDRPPMPPDDPAAHDYSPNPQKPPHKAGIARIQGVGYMEMLDHWDLINRAEREARKKESEKKKDGEKEKDGDKPDKDAPDTKDDPGDKKDEKKAEKKAEKVPPPSPENKDGYLGEVL